MEFFVDGSRRVCDPELNETLDDVLETIRRNNVPRRRAILGLACDGIDVVDDELTTVLAKPITAFERVDIRTGAPNTLIAHALEEALATLQTAERERSDVAAMFGEGRTGEAIILLGTCLGHWHQINEAIAKSLGMMGVMADSLEDDFSQLAGALEPVAEKLSDIKSAVKSQDYVALSDILEYEFNEVTACWRRVIEAILGQVTTTEPQGAAS